MQMTIYSYPWYFGEMERKEASGKIEVLGKVRFQKSLKGCLSLRQDWH